MRLPRWSWCRTESITDASYRVRGYRRHDHKPIVDAEECLAFRSLTCQDLAGSLWFGVRLD